MDIVLRAVIIYALVFIFTRALGRRELSSLQPFDFILLVVIGDLIQSGLTQTDLSVTGVFLALCTIGILQVLTSYLGFRFRRMRPVLQGEPIVLVENGKLVDRNMRRERLTLDDLAEKARLSEIAAIDEIRGRCWKPTATSASSNNRKPDATDRVRATGMSYPAVAHHALYQQSRSLDCTGSRQGRRPPRQFRRSRADSASELQSGAEERAWSASASRHPGAHRWASSTHTAAVPGRCLGSDLGAGPALHRSRGAG